MTAPLLSVVVPAFNAGATLPATLDSLRDQTFADWEAIVVDDGSTDATAAIVERRARDEPRLRLVRQPNGGVSTARNAGIEVARGEWLAFLDADDWLASDAYEQLLGELRERPELDAVHCGWTRMTPDGRPFVEICPRVEEDLFSWHSQNCAFAIHAVVVRRELVERAGRFDPALTTCEDWDLWLRLSRLGTRWGRLDAQLAYYRMRPASASLASRRLLLDGLTVVDRAHRRDDRLDGLDQPRPNGEDASQRQRARMTHAVYSAALAVAQDGDAVDLLYAVGGDRCEELGADQVAYAVFEGVALGVGTTPADWASFPPQVIDDTTRLLAEVERLSGSPELELRARRILGRLVTETGATRTMFGRIESVDVDLERSLTDVVLAPETERLIVRPHYGGLDLARVELPAWDGHVPAALIADAVAEQHAWAILGRFFAAAVLPGLYVGMDAGRVVARRAGRTIVDVPLEEGESVAALVHDYAGWELLLQELCGDPLTSNADVYDPARDDALAPAATVVVSDGWCEIELAAPLPELVCTEPVRVAVTVGGATLTCIEVEPADGLVSAGALRRETFTQSGFELCRLVVREGLVGRPAEGAGTLRERLRDRAAGEPDPPPADVSPGASLAPGWPPAGASPDVSLAPGWQRHVARAVNGYDAAWVIGRRRGATTGLSGSRVALVPSTAGVALVADARAAGDPVIAIGGPGDDAPVVYAPDLVWQHDAVPVATAPPPGEEPGPGRAYFESLFAAGADPWDYTSDYEQGKYDLTLDVLGDVRPGRALELGCAEGHFTRQLAPRVGELYACDVSEIALDRARGRCSSLGNVRFAHHDLFADPIAGTYDLVVCSEVLYYAGNRARLDHAARAIAGALEPDGLLLTAHANLLVDDPERPGFDWEVPFGARVIGEAFAAARLDLVQELANPYYRLQAFRRRRRFRRVRPLRAEAPTPAAVPVAIAERFRPEGGAVRPDGAAEPETWELPILMYHRVAPTGSDRLREWRVTPGELERQLDYLRSAGWATATFEEWRAATERHEPLPGRRVMLTFDDGYEDFAEYAYPLLRAYELDATVFLVSDRVGKTNEWDRGYGEELPLMDWDTIRVLDGQGVAFGGHTATHPMLTSLGLDDVAREASRSRAELIRELGHLVRAFAYPYGEVDAAVARTIGACGFEFAVTTAGYHASASVPMLTLPRLNVAGASPFESFVRMLAPAVT